jgi:hypothetical protein
VGHNALLRRWDRLEGLVVAIVLVAACAAMPLAVWIGAATYHARLGTAVQEMATRHQVEAVLLTDAPIGLERSGPATDTGTRVPGRWSLANGEQRVGPVPARPGARAGTATPVWIDSSGASVTRPLTPRQAFWDGIFAGCYAAIAAMTILVAAWRLARWRIDRARLAWWGREWARVEPEWTHRTR